MSENTPKAVPCANCARLEELVQRLLERVLELEEEVRDLRAQLGKDSSNSSKPPSSDPPWKRPPPKPPSGRKPGGQPGHAGHFRELLPPEKVQHTRHYLPAHCKDCGHALPQAAGPGDPEPWRHQVYELPPQAVVVTEHQAHARTCSSCGKRTRAQIPGDIRARVLGPNLEAALALLSAEYHLSRRQVQALSGRLLGLPLGLGSVINYQQRTSAALHGEHLETVRLVRSAGAKNVDETGWSLSGKSSWLWAAASGEAVSYRHHRARCRTSLAALLGRRPQGVLTHDRWNAYGQLPPEQSQLCWSHLNRDFQALIDRGGDGQALGRKALDVSKKMFEKWRLFRASTLTREELQSALEPLQTELRSALEAACDGPAGKTRRLSKRLLGHFAELWTFAAVPGVEPTNNHIERLLRPAVLWRKISYGCQSSEGIRFVERLLSVVQTLKLQGRDVLQTIATAIVSTRNQITSQPNTT